MLYAIGSKVRFRFTGETGIVIAALDDEMLLVRVDNDPDLEIPAFEEDLVLASAAATVLPSAAFSGNKKTGQPAEVPPRRQLKSQYVILKPKGIQLAFEPMPGRDGTVSRYKAWLINDTGFEFLFSFDLFTASADLIGLDDKLGAMSAIELGDMRSDDLNDQAEMGLEIKRVTTEGTTEPLYKALKIKPKQFFSSFQTVPVLNLPAYQFVLFDRFDDPGSEQNEPDLKSYTRQHTQRVRQQRSVPSNSQPYRAFDVEEFSSFIPELDLHIEALNPAWRKLDRGEIIRLQLQHCDRFIDRAVRLGAHRIYLIHGVGEGKLKDAIAHLLRERPEIVKFRNEYHHKYGYGATEVFLR